MARRFRSTAAVRPFSWTRTPTPGVGRRSSATQGFGDRDSVFTDEDRWGTTAPPPEAATVAEQGQPLKHPAEAAGADHGPTGLVRASRHLIRDCNHFDLVRKRAGQLAEIISGVVEREIDRSYAGYTVRTLGLDADSSKL